MLDETDCYRCQFVGTMTERGHGCGIRVAANSLAQNPKTDRHRDEQCQTEKRASVSFEGRFVM